MSSKSLLTALPELRPGECEPRDEPIEDYLANRGFVSSTQLRRFDRTGLVAVEQTNAGVTTGLMMGEALHRLVLEPETFWSRYLVLDDTRPKQSGGSEEDLMRREWLDAWQWSALSHARDALLNYRRFPVADWLARGRKELSIYWRDTAGNPWKARPDCFTEQVVLEVKTTSDCRPEAFARVRQRFGYDIQAVHYIEAVTQLTGRSPRFLFLTVELTQPYSVWIHEHDDSQLSLARQALEQLKLAYVRTVQTREPAV